MKKLLFSIIFLGSLTVFSEKVSAQSVSKDPIAASLKSEDAVMVAYPNPARDFIIVKSKDASLRIKSVPSIQFWEWKWQNIQSIKIQQK